MVSLRVWALALSASTACAFKDTSPHMVFSSSDVEWTTPAISTGKALADQLAKTFKSCSSDFYVIAQQPEVAAADFRTGSTPLLKEFMDRKAKNVKFSAAVPEVLESLEPAAITDMLQKECGAETMSIDPSGGYIDIVAGKKPKALVVTFPAPANGKGRELALRTNDLYLSNLINSLPSSSFTVLYATTPAPLEAQVLETATYEMDDSMSPLVHLDMKRDLGVEARADSNNVTLVDGPLFERYQYFTPGIFMGLITMFFLLSIAFVGVSALGSLEVSYAAFDKENGPAAQKK